MSQGFLVNLDANVMRTVLIKREEKTAYGSYRCYYDGARKEKEGDKDQLKPAEPISLLEKRYPVNAL